MDKDKDGRIDFNEFTALMTDDNGRPSWFFKAAAISDQIENEGWWGGTFDRGGNRLFGNWLLTYCPWQAIYLLHPHWPSSIYLWSNVLFRYIPKMLGSINSNFISFLKELEYFAALHRIFLLS